MVPGGKLRRSFLTHSARFASGAMRIGQGLVLHKDNTIWAPTGGHRMNLEKFTDRAKGFLQSAQTVAIRMNHQRISPDHLLKALLDDPEGMAAGLLQRS